MHFAIECHEILVNVFAGAFWIVLCKKGTIGTRSANSALRKRLCMSIDIDLLLLCALL